MRLVILALAVLLVGGCSSKAPPIHGFERFVVKAYNWEVDGYDVLVVHADGKASFVGVTASVEQRDGKQVRVPVWYRVDWQAAPATVEALVRHLEQARFLTLDASYIDPAVEDGENEVYMLTTREGVKQVSFRNRAPAEVGRLRTFVRSELEGPQRARLAAGTRLSNAEAEQFWSQF